MIYKMHEQRSKILSYILFVTFEVACIFLKQRTY